MSIYLRELTRSDVKTINVWRNEKKLVDQLGANFRFVNIETDEQWFDQYLKNRASQVRMALIEEETNEFVGVIYILEIDPVNRTGLYAGLLIGEERFQGKGYGSSATQKMLDHAFNNLNLNRLYGYVLEENLRSINVLKKFGFTEEGTLRQHLYKNGEYKNLKIVGILKDEFCSFQKKLSEDSVREAP